MLDPIRRHPLAAFFVLAYLGSWLVWSPWWLSRSGLGILDVDLPTNAHRLINQLGLFAGPFAASLIITRLTTGRAGVRRLLGRVVGWRAHPGWYLVALLVIPVIVGVGYLRLQSTGVATLGIAGAGTLVATYLIGLIGGPIQEEPGWRGFALPRLQERLHPLAAAVLLGVIHGFWHTPLFFTKEWDTARGDIGQLIAFLLLTVSLSLVLSWICNGSRGNLLLPILGHNGINWMITIVPLLIMDPRGGSWPAALGMALLAVFAAVLTKGRLGVGPTAADDHRAAARA